MYQKKRLSFLFHLKRCFAQVITCFLEQFGCYQAALNLFFENVAVFRREIEAPPGNKGLRNLYKCCKQSQKGILGFAS